MPKFYIIKYAVIGLLYGLVAICAALCIAFCWVRAPWQTTSMLWIVGVIIAVASDKDEEPKKTHQVFTPAEYALPQRTYNMEKDLCRCACPSGICEHAWGPESAVAGINVDGKLVNETTQLCSRCGLFRFDHDNFIVPGRKK